MLEWGSAQLQQPATMIDAVVADTEIVSGSDGEMDTEPELDPGVYNVQVHLDDDTDDVSEDASLLE